MEHWQFLIQKQGDRSWHTLESPNVQIVEGRYRVVARSNLPNTDVEVRVTHSSTYEVPPKRRIQKRSRRTNSEGLMAVIPFTLLKPGIWELRCSGDLMSDIFGKSWQHSVCLQVLSQSANGEVEKLTSGGESNSLDFFMAELPYPRNSSQLAGVSDRRLVSKYFSIPAESGINTQSNLVTSEVSTEIASTAKDDAVITTAAEVTEDETAQSVTEISSTGDRTFSEDETAQLVTEIEATGDRNLSVTEDETAQSVTEISSTGDRTFSEDETEIPSTSDRTFSEDETTQSVTEIQLTGDRTFSEDETAQSVTEISSTGDRTFSEDETAQSVTEISSTGDRTFSEDETAQLVTEIEATGDRNLSVTEDETAQSVTEISSTGDRNLSVTETEILSTGDRTFSEDETEIPSTGDRTFSEDETEIPSTGDRTFSEDETTQSLIEIPSTEEITESDLVVSEVASEQAEDGIIDQPVSPVWLKGETAEQILQSLMEQALPLSELLLEDEELEETPTIQSAPPLKLILEQESYVARWGQGLSINARVELQAKPHLEDEPEYSTTLHALEVKIELRSPLSSEILNQVQQNLADNSLPLTINSAINIPVDCESKLLLGEFSLYGALTAFDEVILLASHSFTVTADVTELLAMTFVPKPNQQNLFDSSENQEPENSVSLGLELFNLVKTPLSQPQTIPTSSNQPLPPQINLSSVKKSEDLRSPQLPKLPENQTGAIAIDDAVTESSSQEKEEVEQPDNTTPAPTTISPAPINLEQLEIKNRRGWMLGNLFPYLKRLKTRPADKTQVTTNPADVFETPVAEDSLQLKSVIVTPENSEADDSEVETSTAANSELTAESLPEITQVNSELTAESLSEITEINSKSSAESLPEITQVNSELTAESLPEIAPTASLEFNDNSISKPAAPLNSELITEIPYASPLIRKWMQSQGYSVPELPPVAYQSQKTEVVEPEIVSIPEVLPELDLSSNLDEELADLDGESENQIDTERSLLSSQLQEDTNIRIIHEQPEELNISTEADTENITPELSAPSLPLAQLPLTQKIKIPRVWLAQEIVVDDTYSEMTEDATESFSLEQPQSISSVSNSLPVNREIVEPLPVPQLHIPAGELIAGQSIRVRVELPKVSPEVVVKLWMEDCQTRVLLDGPHLLRDLLPKSLGGVEAMTQINVPFGCVEIRLEAIALNTSTQQESHKATAVRTVIPPDLPNYQPDELLGL